MWWHDGPEHKPARRKARLGPRPRPEGEVAWWGCFCWGVALIFVIEPLKAAALDDRRWKGRERRKRARSGQTQVGAAERGAEERAVKNGPEERAEVRASPGLRLRPIRS